MRSLPLFLAAALTACVSAPPFKTPQTAVPERYTNEPLSAVSLNTVGNGSPGAEWWKQFESPQLDATVAAALTGNRSLAVAQANLRQAQELAGAQRGALLPNVELAAGAGRQKYGAAFLGAAAGDFPPFTYYSVGANVSYLLDYAGGAHSAVEERLAMAEVQQHTLEAARLTLAGNVVLQALAVASAREQLRAAQGIVDEDAKNVDLVQKALDAGSVARLDLLTAQSQLADDETLLPPLRQQLSVARHALAVLVGQAPADFAVPEFTLAEFVAPQEVPLSLPSELARRRPDIRAEEARLHAATAAVGVATANLYPQIKLTGSLSQQALTTDGLFKGSSDAFWPGGQSHGAALQWRTLARRAAGIDCGRWSQRSPAISRRCSRLLGRSPTCSPRLSTTPSRSAPSRKPWMRRRPISP